MYLSYTSTCIKLSNVAKGKCEMQTITQLYKATQKNFLGVALAGSIGAIGLIAQFGEERFLGHAILDGLVLAILIGMILRAVWTPNEHWTPGIKFSAKPILEVAIVLLGASVDLPTLLKAGPALALAIVVVVVLDITIGTGIGRAFGLDAKHATLVACGNSICGNSAIAALAPVIDAKEEQVASSITFMAVMSIVVVVGLPLLFPLLGMSYFQYGVLAGLSVYAVPQVLAATGISAVSGQIGTLVKLVRVLMLGPVAIFLSLRYAKEGAQETKLQMVKMVPWFIIGFALLGLVRSMGWLPLEVVAPMRTASAWLTIVAMAALGLMADLRVVKKIGKPLLLSVVGSVAVLLTLSFTLIHLLHL